MKSRRNFLLPGICIVLFCLTALASDPSPEIVSKIAKKATKTAPTEDPILVNFHVVVPDLVFRGGRLKTQKEFEYLEARYKIKTVINLQGADPKPFWTFEPGERKSVRNLQKNMAYSSGITYWINIPLDSWNKVSKLEADKINNILEIINDPTAQPVYIHCEHGKDRTGLVMGLFQVFYQTPPVSPQTALSTMYLFGHSELLREMDEYFNLATTPPMGLQKLDP